MYKLNQFISSIAHNRKVQIAIMVIAIALFVFASSAPNATIGIGK